MKSLGKPPTPQATLASWHEACAHAYGECTVGKWVWDRGCQPQALPRVGVCVTYRMRAFLGCWLTPVGG